MKYYLYWEEGSAQYGDLSAELECYDTLEEVQARKEELKDRHKIQFTIIEGNEIF